MHRNLWDISGTGHRRRRLVVPCFMLSVLAASLLVGVTAAADASVLSDASTSTGSSTSQTATAHTAAGSSSRAVAGRRLTAKLSDSPRVYTRAELTELNAGLVDSEDMHKGRTVASTATVPLNAAATAPDQSRQSTSILRDSRVPTTGIKGGASSASSTQEPSTDANGGNIFQTGNWYATRSVNNGSSWSYLDPYGLFGSGFCCDQVTQYDRATGRQFWLLQYNNRLVLANASATGTSAFTNWCYYNIDATWFGLAAGTPLDYNDISISNNNVNISTNFFGSSSGAALVRLPKYAMSSCSGFSYSRMNRTDNFTFKLVPGSTSTLYFGSNWGQSNGSSFRVFSWPEASSSYTYSTRTVASYGFYTRNSGQNCASRDGVVKNWCQYADSRSLGAYRTGGVLGFSFNAKQDAAHPFPYTRLVWFRESDKAYLGAGDLWGSFGAVQFLTLAPNSVGRVGGVFAWGGGTGTTHYYPGAATYSTTSTAVATDPNYFLFGGGNTCTYSGLYRWGDYLTVRTSKANTAQWIAAVYAIKGGNCGSASAYAEPHNVLFS